MSDQKKSQKNKYEKLARQINLNKVKSLQVVFTPPNFSSYAPPNGFIPVERAAHALMYYALLAKKQYDELIVDPLVYEGENDVVPNFHQLFKSIALMYGVEPQEMIRFWINVDMQFDVLNLARVPDADFFRFNLTPQIVTETKQ